MMNTACTYKLKVLNNCKFTDENDNLIQYNKGEIIESGSYMQNKKWFLRLEMFLKNGLLEIEDFKNILPNKKKKNKVDDG